jgi:superfamily I DNA/RNA helicase
MAETQPEKPITYSPEQKAVFAAGDGFFCVIANAGSGKTEVSAEKVSRLAQTEAKKNYPARKPTSDEMGKILSQFLVVTFTKKAAAELDARVKKKLIAAGLPEPTDRGRPYRVCSTLDSYLQRWLKNPGFFDLWMRHDVARAHALSLLHQSLGTKARAWIDEVLQRTKRGSPLLALFYSWDGLLVESRQNALIDMLIRMEFNQATLPGLSWDDIQREFSDFKANLDPAAENGWRSTFLDKFAAIFGTWDAEMKHLALRAQDPKNHGGVLDVMQTAALENWETLTQARTEFLSVHEIARARQYDPETRTAGLGHPDAVQVLASAKVLLSLRQAHSIALGYKRLKRFLGLMDFGDFLTVFMDVIRRFPLILERDREYPARGIRRKYVVWDETQDNTPTQFYLLEEMYKGVTVPHFAMCVGDPGQAMYEWRGASPYQFIRIIEDMRENHPKHLLALSCSFRSAKRIVNLGNVIIRKLSRNGDIAKPSRTVYKEEGVIRVGPVFESELDEARWVIDEMETIRAREGGTFMIVIRSMLALHPIYALVKASGHTDVQMLTVHAAKGLEADHVFVIGVMATKFPDVRGNPDQEANCFYVACTRPRRTLLLSTSIMEESLDSAGNPAVKMVGPSPYFSQIPEIKELALAAGWDENLFAMGTQSHKAGVAAVLQATEKKMRALEIEAHEFFGKGLTPPEPRSRYYLGAISQFENAPVIAELPAPVGSGEAKRPPSEDEKAKLRAKIRSAFFKGHAGAGALSSRERSIALQLNWLEFKQGRMSYTAEVKRIIRESAA